MKNIAIILLLLAASVSHAQVPRPKFSTGSRNLNFGNVVVGKSRQLFTQFRVDSTATAPVTVVCTYPRTPQYSIIGDTQFTLEVGALRNLTIEYAPTALMQDTDRIFFTHNGDTSVVPASSSIALNGTGIASDTFPKISISPGFGFLQFGGVEVGKTAERSFRIQNSTDTIRQLTGTITPPSPPFSISSGGDPFSLESYDTVRVFITFTPTKDTTYFDSVIITTNADSANRIRKVFFAATGTKPGSDTIPRMTVFGTGGGVGVNFGNLKADSSAARYISIRNSSIVNKQLMVTVGTPTMSIFTVDSGGGALVIDSGMTSTVKLRFSPTSAGEFRDSLYLTSNAIEPNNNYKVILRGESTSSSVERAQVLANSIRLYPNPAHDNTTASFFLEHAENIAVSVYNLEGKEVMNVSQKLYSSGFNTIPIETRGLPTGTYQVYFKLSHSAVPILMVIER